MTPSFILSLLLILCGETTQPLAASFSVEEKLSIDARSAAPLPPRDHSMAELIKIDPTLIEAATKERMAAAFYASQGSFETFFNTFFRPVASSALPLSPPSSST